MAFPVIASVTATSFGTDATAHLVAMPATVDANDLLIALFANDGSATVTTPANWNLIDSTANGADARFSSYYKIAVGNEDGTTVDFVTSATEKAAAQVYRITAATWHGTTPPETAAAATGANAGPDPPSTTPSWGTEDTMWIAAYGADDDDDASAYPTNYTNGTYTQSDNSTSSASMGSARREFANASDNPGIFTIAAGEQWITITLAIRPAAGGTIVTPATIAAVGSLPTPAILAASIVTPAVVAGIGALPIPSILAASVVEPTSIAALAALPTPTILAGALVTPAAIAGVAALPTPAILAEALVTPAVIAALSALPTPTIIVGGTPVTVTPDVIAALGALPTPAILAAAVVTPSGIAVVTMLPTPSILAGALVAPSTVMLISALPTPSVLVAATVEPATIAALIALATPSILAGSVITPATIALLAALPTPVIITGALTFWTRTPVGYTRTPVGFVRIGAGDTPPW